MKTKKWPKTVQSAVLLFIACSILFVVPAKAQEEGLVSVQLDVQEISEKIPSHGCAAAAATNILGYWAKSGWGKKLFPQSANASAPESTDINNLAVALEKNMRTNASGTTYVPFVGWGIQQTLKEYKIEGKVRSLPCTFDFIKMEIDAGRPCFVGNSFERDIIYSNHYVCVTGYGIDNRPDAEYKYALLIHDGYGEGESDVPQGTAEHPREVQWYTGLISYRISNPMFLWSVELEKDEDPCDASQYLEFTVAEPEYAGDTKHWCEADMHVKNSSPNTKIWVARKVDNSWSCLTYVCQTLDPGADQLAANSFSYYPDNGVCTERDLTDYIAVKDTKECEEIFDSIRTTGEVPEGLTIKKAESDVCTCTE